MIDEYKLELEEIIERASDDIRSMRAARATPEIVERVMVDAYDVKTPVPQLATISIPDPRTIVIQPWDKAVVKAIEDAIRISDIGLNPVNEGEQIRLVIPQLTEERRKELVKAVSQKVEQYRIRIRQARDKFKDMIISAEKNKEISEDDKFNQLESLDKVTSEYNAKIKEIGDAKEKDIMTI